MISPDNHSEICFYRLRFPSMTYQQSNRHSMQRYQQEDQIRVQGPHYSALQLV